MFKITIVLLSLFMSFNLLAETTVKPLQFEEISNNVFLVKSYREFESSKGSEQHIIIDSNSLVYINGKNAYLIDTPWNASNMPQLMTWIKEKGLTLQKTVFTHSHEDRTGGLAYLHKHEFNTYASTLTNELLNIDNQEVTSHEILGNEFVLLENTIEIFYPGEGHTKDNLVIWLPKEKIVFGGCLIRSNETNNLGWTGNANVNDWSGSAQKVLSKYPEAKLIVPGHGKIGKGTTMISHTIDLAG
jgi:metallo-beta-lactamase class B